MKFYLIFFYSDIKNQILNLKNNKNIELLNNIVEFINKNYKRGNTINVNCDLIFLHATRIVERKQIELVIDFVEYFKKSVYFDKLKYNNKKLYNGKVLDINSKIEIKNQFKNRSDSKNLTLWQLYLIVDAVTYISINEGFGNQLLEGIRALKPMVVFEYPVSQVDIKPLKFNYISLGSVVDEKIMVSNDILDLASLQLYNYLIKKETKKN